MIEELLNELNMQGALSYYQKVDEGEYESSNLLENMLRSECYARNEKKIVSRLKTAGYPYEKEWSQVNLTANPKIPFKKLKSYSSGAFIKEKKNICFIGAPGLGKTHSLVAIGRDLCRLGKTVKFYTAMDLITKLEEARGDSRLSKLMANLMKPDLLIIDELGFVPLGDEGARLLFDVFSKRYDKGSLAISTNLSLPKWVQTFGSIELTNALIDRFSHRCDIHIFEGESYRFIESKKNVEEKQITN